MHQHRLIVTLTIAFTLAASLAFARSAQGANAFTLRAQDDSSERRVLRVPQRRRIRARGDRRRSRGIGAAYGRAGRRYGQGGRAMGRGGARFGRNIGRGKPIVAGRELGRGAGGFGKGVGKGTGNVGVGTARVGKKVGRATRRFFRGGK